MDDVASLSETELVARLHDGITRRLDASTPQDRARAGAELIAVIQEMRRRDPGRAACDGLAASSRDGSADGHRDGRSDARPVHALPPRRA